MGVLAEKNREVEDLFLDSVHVELYENTWVKVQNFQNPEL